MTDVQITEEAIEYARFLIGSSEMRNYAVRDFYAGYKAAQAKGNWTDEDMINCFNAGEVYGSLVTANKLDDENEYILTADSCEYLQQLKLKLKQLQ